MAVLEHSGTASVPLIAHRTWMLNQPNVQEEGVCLVARRLGMHELADVGWSVLKMAHFVGPLVPSNFVDCFTIFK